MSAGKTELERRASAMCIIVAVFVILMLALVIAAIVAAIHYNSTKDQNPGGEDAMYCMTDIGTTCPVMHLKGKEERHV